MTKILFTDLDGTLLNDAKEITAGNRSAILEALALGHKIVITTGRATACAIELANRLGLTMEGCYVIAFNGGCIYDVCRKTAIYTRTLPLKHVRRLLDTAHELGVHAHTYLGSIVLAERDTPDLRKYAAASGLDYKVVPDACACLIKEPCKVLAVNYTHHEPLEAYRDAVAKWCAGKADTYFSCRELLEIVPPGVTKGIAIRILCRHLGISIEDTISVGDADNDISMLQTTHTSVVMKNAADYMYPYGTYITRQDNNHDGIAEVIHEFILGGRT